MNAFNLQKVLKLSRVMLPMYLLSLVKPRIIWAHLYVTRKCNLSCSYCVVTSYPSYSNPLKKDLKVEEMKHVIDDLYRLGCRFISFFGGEPTIRKDLAELICYANQKPMITHITTNGTLLSDEYIDNLGKAKLDVINLSIDSVAEFDDSQKDIVRSNEVFKRLLSGRRNYGYELNVNAVLTPENLDQIIPTVSFMQEHRVPVSIGFVNEDTYTHAPQWDFEKNNFSSAIKEKIKRKPRLTKGFDDPEKRQKLYVVLDQLKEFKRTKHWIIEPISYFDDIKKFVNGELEDWDCGAGSNYISVDSNGKIQLCSSSPTEDIHISELGSDYSKVLEIMRDKRMHEGTAQAPACKSLCLSNCLYDVTFFLRNPLHFFKGIIA